MITETETPQAEIAYLARYKRAMRALKRIEEKIHDMPAPQSEIEIDWGHVGDMGRIAEQLEDVAP